MIFLIPNPYIYFSHAHCMLLFFKFAKRGSTLRSSSATIFHSHLFQIQSLSIFVTNLLHVVTLLLRNRKKSLCYRAYYPHLGFTGFSTIQFSQPHKNNQQGNDIIISLLNLVVLSSNRCLVPVRFSIIVTTYLVTITLKKIMQVQQISMFMKNLRIRVRSHHRRNLVSHLFQEYRIHPLFLHQ